MTAILEIGPFRLDRNIGVLTRDGRATPLGPRAAAVLKTLVEHANELVSKRSIMDAAWPGLVVEEGNIAMQIAAIRRVLTQGGGDAWIETLPRRGYRFVGPVAEAADDRPAVSPAVLSNLRMPPTSFVGRERELAEVKRLLPASRLVTLQGAGGIGKTRLALQVAAEVIEAYRDGVWIAELASIRDPSLVSGTVGQLLGVTDRRGRSSTDSIRAYLKSRQLLLVLDNCEHLVGACAQLADAVLGDTRGVTILATSREPLRICAEQSYLLEPLSLPDARSHDAIRSSEAVQLFVERVQHHLAGFALTPAREPAVAGICIHLDGIPLALELAAARARSLSVEQINARLGDRFRLLTGGSRSALPRQQTLRATLDWSYDLLAEDERVVLRRLSTFPGTFTVEAACAVAFDERIDEHAVLDLLSQLVSRSLVIADTTTIVTRYRLLETTRGYALEKLDEVGETAAMQRRHAHYFRAHFDHATKDSLRLADDDWHAHYIPELDNVRAAIDWGLASGGEPALAIALAGASGPLWTTLSLYGEGLQRLNAAVARLPTDTTASEEARLWLWLGTLARQVDPVASLPAYERAAILYRECDQPLELALTNARLAHVLANGGWFERAKAALAEALPALEHQRLPKPLGMYFGAAGFLKVMTGDVAGALRDFETASALFREAGNEFGVVETISNVAQLKWALGDLDGADASLREYIAMRGRSSVRKSRLGAAFAVLAGVLTERGDLEQALDAAREGLSLIQQDSANAAWKYMDHFALRAARAGKVQNGARIAGYADACFAGKETTRQPNEARARDHLRGIFRDMVAPYDLERLFAEGAKMSEDDACRLALEE
jgi:predicted ATPase/DNA-binding winged helix-turn-helix (wHTH) protein